MKLSRIISIGRHLGFGWLAYRGWQAALGRTGHLRRRLPDRPWEGYPLADLLSDPAAAAPERYRELRRGLGGHFFFSPDHRQAYAPVLRGFDDGSDALTRRIDELAAGRMRYFSGQRYDIGWPPDWHRNPITGRRAPDTGHFSRLDEFGFGDVKVIWEPNRFSFVYDLARAYWRTGDDRCPTMFWEAIEDWRKANPPHTGVNWKCGQETSLRVMAWCFGLHAFGDHEQTTAARVAMLAQMVGVSALRVERHIHYALSQKNNHGISEGMGLWTMGLLFPELAGSERWRRVGRRVLESQGRELIYDDGGFSQHSANYHRVMLHDYLWAIRLGDLNDQPLSDPLRRRVGRAGVFLGSIMDRPTGRVPRYGQDDGARILPLTDCAYEDYRPAVQATAGLVDERLALEAGPWDEALVWLFGPEALKRDRQPPDDADFAAPQAGCHVLHRPQGMAMVRGGPFVHRPAQLDLLHVDLWWRGCNVALDPGTYSYNAAPPWDTIPLALSAQHNTVTVDGKEPAQQVSRFMYLPWPKAWVAGVHRSAGGALACVELEHDGYCRLGDPVTHRRAVVAVGEAHWVVLDRLVGKAPHEYRLHWLLTDTEHQWDADTLTLHLKPAGGEYQIHLGGDPSPTADLARARESSPRGWYAPRYMELAPALSLAASSSSPSVWFWSVLGPAGFEVKADAGPRRLRLRTDRGEAQLDLADDRNDGSLLAGAEFQWADGSDGPDRLELAD